MLLVSEREVRERQLATAYTNNAGRHVAFLDESYFAPSFRAASTAPPFYLFTAYVVPVDGMVQMRNDLPDVVGSTFWHSTEAHRSEHGQDRILDFANYVADGDEPVIVALQQPIEDRDRDGELARGRCFSTLLSVLGAGTKCEPVSLAVFEERKFQTQRAADASTIKSARNRGLIPRSMTVLPNSPTYERLLWLPDLVSFALYQSLAERMDDYADPFRDRVQLIER